MFRESLSWRAHARHPALWVGLLCLCLTALFVPLGLHELNKARLLDSDGIETRATVIDHATHTSRSNNGTRRVSYSLTLRFADQQGTPRSTRIAVSSQTYQRLGIGSQTPLRYVASDPAITEVEPGDTRSDGLILSGAGALGALGLGLCLILFLRATAAQRRVLKTGERRTAWIVAHHPVGKARARTFAAEWSDGRITGRTRTLKEAALPAIGAAISVCLDPVGGKGWWVEDL
jgi:hypothetical protein